MSFCFSRLTLSNESNPAASISARCRTRASSATPYRLSASFGTWYCAGTIWPSTICGGWRLRNLGVDHQQPLALRRGRIPSLSSRETDFTFSSTALLRAAALSCSVLPGSILSIGRAVGDAALRGRRGSRRERQRRIAGRIGGNELLHRRVGGECPDNRPLRHLRRSCRASAVTSATCRPWEDGRNQRRRAARGDFARLAAADQNRVDLPGKLLSDRRHAGRRSVKQQHHSPALGARLGQNRGNASSRRLDLDPGKLLGRAPAAPPAPREIRSRRRSRFLPRPPASPYKAETEACRNRHPAGLPKSA